MFAIVTHPSPANPGRTVIEVVTGKSRALKSCDNVPNGKVNSAVAAILAGLSGEGELIEWTTSGAGAAKTCTIQTHLRRSRDGVQEDVLAKRAEAAKRREAAKKEDARAAAKEARKTTGPKAAAGAETTGAKGKTAAAAVAMPPVPGLDIPGGKAPAKKAADAATTEPAKKNKGAAVYQRWIKRYRKDNAGATHAQAVAAYKAHKAAKNA